MRTRGSSFERPWRDFLGADEEEYTEDDIDFRLAPKQMPFELPVLFILLFDRSNRTPHDSTRDPKDHNQVSDLPRSDIGFSLAYQNPSCTQHLHVPPSSPPLLFSLITFCRNTAHTSRQPLLTPTQRNKRRTHHLRQRPGSPASPAPSSPDPSDSSPAPRLSARRTRARRAVSAGLGFASAWALRQYLPSRFDGPFRRRSPCRCPPGPRM